MKDLHHYHDGQRRRLAQCDLLILDFARALQAVGLAHYEPACKGWFTLHDVATKANCLPGTVGSRLRQFVAWGLITKKRRWHAGQFWYQITVEDGQLCLFERAA